MSETLTSLPSQTAVTPPTPPELEPGATAAAAAPAPPSAPAEAPAPAEGAAPAPTTPPIRTTRQFPTLVEPPQPPSSQNLQELIAQSMKKQEELLAHRETPPTPPHLRIDLPKPPKFAPVPLVENFSSLAAVFGVLGALRSRAPLTNALVGLAGAMNGMTQGNQEAYEKGVTEWKNQTDVAIRENELLAQQYNMARTAYKDRDDQVMAQWNAIATLNKDAIQIFNLQKGDYDAARQRVQDLNTITTKMWEAQEHMLEMDPKRFAWMDRQRSIRESGREPTSEDALNFSQDWDKYTKGQGRMAANSLQRMGNLMQGANVIMTSIDMLGKMGLPSGGMFASVTNKGGDFTGAMKAQAALQLSSQMEIAANTVQSTLGAEMAKVVSGGSLAPGQTQIQKYDRQYAITARDTLFTAAFKMAFLATELRASLEVSPSFSEEQRQQKEALLEKLRKYRDPLEIMELFGMTLYDYADTILKTGQELPDRLQGTLGARPAGGAAETPAQRFLRENPEAARIVNDPNMTEAQKREALKKLGLQ